jgi:hypothetical protein
LGDPIDGGGPTAGGPDTSSESGADVDRPLVESGTGALDSAGGEPSPSDAMAKSDVVAPMDADSGTAALDSADGEPNPNDATASSDTAAPLDAGTAPDAIATPDAGMPPDAPSGDTGGPCDDAPDGFLCGCASGLDCADAGGCCCSISGLAPACDNKRSCTVFNGGSCL